MAHIYAPFLDGGMNYLPTRGVTDSANTAAHVRRLQKLVDEEAPGPPFAY